MSESVSIILPPTALDQVINDLQHKPMLMRYDRSLQPQEEPDQRSPQKAKGNKGQPKTPARRDIFSATSKVMEEPNKTEINEFEIKTNQVAFDSDFSD